MKQLLHDHAARVICEHLEAGHHPGDLFADAGRALAAYDPATLNYHWLIIAHTAVCRKFPPYCRAVLASGSPSLSYPTIS